MCPMDKVLLIENLNLSGYEKGYPEVLHVVTHIINQCWIEKKPLPALKLESNGEGWRLTVPEELCGLLPVVPQKGYAWEAPTIDAATAEAYRVAARNEYGSDDIEIDDNAVISMGDDPGGFVAAWGMGRRGRT